MEWKFPITQQSKSVKLCAFFFLVLKLTVVGLGFLNVSQKLNGEMEKDGKQPGPQ